jgi:hypothetical protein
LPTVWSGRCSWGGRDDRPPAAGGPRLGERHLRDPAIQLARLVIGADDVKREVLEHSDADAATRRRRAVGAPEDPVVDRFGGPGEAISVEGADRRRSRPTSS